MFKNCFRLVIECLAGFLCCENRGNLVLLLWILLALSSCTITRYVPVETIRTEYKVNTLHDSIYITRWDSVYVDKKNDTVMIERWHTLYKDRFIERTDTFIKRDTITSLVEVEKSLSWWERKKIEFGELAIFVMVGLFFILLIKIFRK